MACFLSCKNKQYVARHQRVRIDKKGSSHLMSQPTEPSNASGYLTMGSLSNQCGAFPFHFALVLTWRVIALTSSFNVEMHVLLHNRGSAWLLGYITCM